MKYLGEETTREVVKQTVRRIEYIRCDKCEKKIIPAKYREKKTIIFIFTLGTTIGEMIALTATTETIIAKIVQKKLLQNIFQEQTGRKNLN